MNTVRLTSGLFLGFGEIAPGGHVRLVHDAMPLKIKLDPTSAILWGKNLGQLVVVRYDPQAKFTDRVVGIEQVARALETYYDEGSRS